MDLRMNHLRTLMRAYLSMSPADKEIFLQFGSTLATPRVDISPPRSGSVFPFPRRIHAPRQRLDQCVEGSAAIVIGEPVDGQ